MDTRARAQELVDQLAGDIGLEDLAFDEEGVIDLSLDDGRRISLGVDPGAEAIVILGPVGGPTANLSRRTLRRLLETGAADGPAVALDAENDRICLQDRFRLRASADYALFKERLLAFMAEQERWLTDLEPELGAELSLGSDANAGTAPFRWPGVTIRG